MVVDNPIFQLPRLKFLKSSLALLSHITHSICLQIQKPANSILPAFTTFVVCIIALQLHFHNGLSTLEGVILLKMFVGPCQFPVSNLPLTSYHTILKPKSLWWCTEPHEINLWLPFSPVLIELLHWSQIQPHWPLPYSLSKLGIFTTQGLKRQVFLFPLPGAVFLLNIHMLSPSSILYFLKSFFDSETFSDNPLKVQ